METFTAASHHDILVLLVQVTVLLLTARLLGEASQRLGQPAVVGEILAGILLGPSLLSGLVPTIGYWIVPHNEVQGYLLELVGLLGVMFLLLITGLETDLQLIRRQARTAVGVAAGGLILPLIGGFLLARYVLPDEMLADPDQRFVFSMFVATAMSISAIPVVAKVLIDLRIMRRDASQTILAAAMIDDTVGWILLSVVIGIAAGAAVTFGAVAFSIGRVLGFMLFSAIVGQWLVNRLINLVHNRINSRDAVLSLVVILMFAWAVITQALNLESILGAFVMGILLSRVPSLESDVVHRLESVAFGIFAPIFFAVAGLKVDILQLLTPRSLLFTVLVIVVAAMVKMGGVFLGARLLGGVRDNWTALFFGAGLNARGSLEIIIATIGLNLGIISQEMFSIIVVMAVVTSLMAPPILRWTLKRIEPDEQERERLRQEELSQGSLIAGLRRVLLPVRTRPSTEGSPVQTVTAEVLEAVGKNSRLEATLFSVAQPGQETAATQYLDKLSPLFSEVTLNRKVVPGTDVAQAILEEARRGYDLIMLGATERQPGEGGLFNPMIDEIIRLSPCPTVVVRGQKETAEDWSPRRILLPTNGTLAARRAAELAFALANGNEEVFILNVAQTRNGSMMAMVNMDQWEENLNISRQIVGEIAELGRSMNVTSHALIQTGEYLEEVILEVAEREQIDLMILGTNVRPGSSRLYLGPHVEHILQNATIPVIVMNIN